MERRRFSAYDSKYKLTSKEQDDIAATLRRFSNDNFQITMRSIDKDCFELELTGIISRHTTRIISTFLSKQCSLAHMFVPLANGKRRLFKTIKI